MKEYDVIEKEVKRRLSEKRFFHSVSTMERAVEYAKIYGEDEKKAKMIAISHDIAKELTKDNIDQMIKKYQIQLDEMEKNNIALSHSKIGAEICKNEFRFDEEMCNAISYHTTGRENMSMMEKIIFVADATGRDRQFEDTEQIYEIAKINIDKAMIKILKSTIEEILQKGKTIHLNTIKTYNYYINDTVD